jgi:hypothetical protein
MHLIFSLFVLAQQSAGVPWKVLIITGLLLVAGIVLTVYFFRRFRKSEAETEEDWSLSRSTLLGAAQLARPPVEARAAEHGDIETAEGNQAAASLKPPADQKEKQPAVESTPEPEPALVIDKTPQPAEPARPPVIAEEQVARTREVPSAPTVEARIPEQQHPSGTDVSAEVPSEAPSIGAHTIAPPGVTDEEYHQSLQQPFEEEIWADLEAPQAPLARGEAPLGGRTRRQPFEPPRIEPLVARDRPAPGQTTGETARVQSRRSSPATLQAPPPEPSERKPAAREIAEPAPLVSPAAFQPAARTSLNQPAGSILGLPAEATSGPLVLGEPRHSVDESDIGTLSNYGKERDDGAGHGGTIALAVVILIIAGVLLAYLFVPSVHSSIDGMVARARGTHQDEAPKAQIFKATYDPTKTPIEATGIVQNTSQETLTDLSVEVKLERKGGGGSDTKTVPVTPSEIAPNAQGTFQFELDGKQYQRFGVTRLLGKNGTEVKFVKPDLEK